MNFEYYCQEFGKVYVAGNINYLVFDITRDASNNKYILKTISTEDPKNRKTQIMHQKQYLPLVWCMEFMITEEINF